MAIDMKLKAEAAIEAALSSDDPDLQLDGAQVYYLRGIARYLGTIARVLEEHVPKRFGSYVPEVKRAVR